MMMREIDKMLALFGIVNSSDSYRVAGSASITSSAQATRTP